MEIREREKRVESVIIRGLGSDVDSVSRKFSEVVSYLFSHNKVIQLVELVPINQDLVRAKIKDSTIRKELLSVTKNLKDSYYDKVFITKDLTFKQREKLKKRLSARKNNIHPQNPANATDSAASDSGRVGQCARDKVVSATVAADGTSSSTSDSQTTKN